MERTTLGRTGIGVSAWCLGTMTWGNQTPEDDAHRQIDAALDHGIDFLDAAEMYPVNPVRKETAGRTEEIIGNWIARTGRRDDIVVATKIAGRGNAIRGEAGITPATLDEAVEGSLRRLRCERIDLYQFHWPDRGSFMFRQNWRFDPRRQPPTADILDNMAAVADRLAGLVREGKIRAFGLSNDSAWGTMNWLAALREAGGPRVASVQNEYSLLCRLFDTDMAELAHHEDVTLLAFSPLAAGFLTGKYQNGAVPEGSRMSLNETMGGRRSARVEAAVAAYLDIARRHGLDPVHMAIAWVRTRPFPSIPIFGATTFTQLERILAGTGTQLSGDVLDEIGEAHKAHPMPY